jgi:hypothetical protein
MIDRGQSGRRCQPRPEGRSARRCRLKRRRSLPLICAASCSTCTTCTGRRDEVPRFFTPRISSFRVPPTVEGLLMRWPKGWRSGWRPWRPISGRPWHRRDRRSAIPPVGRRHQIVAIRRRRCASPPKPQEPQSHQSEPITAICSTMGSRRVR